MRCLCWWRRTGIVPIGPVSRLALNVALRHVDHLEDTLRCTDEELAVLVLGKCNDLAEVVTTTNRRRRTAFPSKIADRFE